MAAGVVAVDRGASRTAASRRAIAAGRAPVMGIALLAVGVFGVGVVGARVAQSATPQGDRRRIPVVRNGAARAQPDNAARVHRLRDRGLRHRPAVAAARPCTSTGNRSRSARRCLRRLRAHRRRCDHRPTALQLLDSSNTTAVLYGRGPLTDELGASPGWTRSSTRRPRNAPLRARRRVHGHDRRVVRRGRQRLTARRDRAAGVRSSAMRLIGVTGGIATGKSTVDRDARGARRSGDRRRRSSRARSVRPRRAGAGGGGRSDSDRT